MITREDIRELAAFQSNGDGCALSFYFQPHTPQNRSHKEDTILAKDLVRQALREAEKHGKDGCAREDLDRILEIAGNLRGNQARAKAEEVRQLARDGRDFAALARQFSEGPGAENGGDIGTFARGQMEPALEETAFRLKPGDVSAPVRTAAGFHLLRTEEDIAAGHKSLDEVRDTIRDALYNEALEERFQQWLSRDLRERHHVEVLE